MVARTDNLVGALALALSDRLDDVLAHSSGLRVPDAAVLNVVGQFPGGTIESVRAVLGIPEDVVTWAMIPMGHPTGRWAEARRRPVAEVTYWDTWKEPPPTPA